MSNFCKCKSVSVHDFVYAIFDDQRFNDTLTNDIDSFELLGPGRFLLQCRELFVQCRELFRLPVCFPAHQAPSDRGLLKTQREQIFSV